MRRGIPFGLLAGAGVVAAVVLIVSTKDHEGDQLRQIGAPVADSLDAYARRHHACPPALGAIGLAPAVTKYGAFLYRTWDDGRKCELSVGVFARDGFEEYWLYPPGDWYSNR
jgi:hypothetical protein